MISEPFACAPRASPHSPSRRTVPGATALAPARPSSSDLRRGLFGRLMRILRALDDHWLGDLIGALSLFVLLWLGLMAAWVLS